MLCIGSSLEVYPVAQLPELTLGRGGQIAILTQGPTPFDRHAAVRMRGDVVAELEALLGALEIERPVGDGLKRSRPLGPSAPLRSARAVNATDARSWRLSGPASADWAATATGSRWPRSSASRSPRVAAAASPGSSASAASSAISTCSAASRSRP